MRRRFPGDKVVTVYLSERVCVVTTDWHRRAMVRDGEPPSSLHLSGGTVIARKYVQDGVGLRRSRVRHRERCIFGEARCGIGERFLVDVVEGSAIRLSSGMHANDLPRTSITTQIPHIYYTAFR
jgi:hypothetical protein